MNKIARIILTILIIFNYTYLAMSQSRHLTTVNATASATIVNPTSLKQSSEQNNIVLVAPNSTVLKTNNSNKSTIKQSMSTNFSTASTTNTIATFTVTGLGNTTYNITITPTIVLTKNDASSLITLNTFVSRSSLFAKTGVVSTLNSFGEDTFSICGVVNLSSSQKSGFYSGTYNVTVAYN